MSNFVSLPSHYEKYKVEEQKIMVTNHERNLKILSVSYDGLEGTKEVDLVSPSEEPNLVYIAKKQADQDLA